jgi:hypothetical protein
MLRKIFQISLEQEKDIATATVNFQSLFLFRIYQTS